MSRNTSSVGLSPASSYNIPRIGAAAFGLLGFATGIRGILDPAAFAVAFGLSYDDLGSSKDVIPILAGRNISVGLTLMAFSYINDRRAIGLHMVCGMATGLIDAIVCYRRGSKDAAYGHGSMCALFGALGSYLLWSL